MSVLVPTTTEFDALLARVAALEAAQPKPPAVTGVQAARIADFVSVFGVNTFSSMSATANVWGSYPADYSPASVNAALDWLLNGSTYRLHGREYHYAGRESIQKPWLQALNKRLRFSMCIGANGDVSAVPSMLALAADPTLGIEWVEGINEPNGDFGHGQKPVADTLAAQQALTGNSRMGPSIVFGLPRPEGWITGYMGSSATAMVAAMDIGNGHFYPPSHCDADAGAGPAFADVVRGMGIGYPSKPVAITEFHPTLYNSASPKIAPGGAIDGYWLLLAWLRAYQLGIRSLHWYALFDYGTVYICGLFHTTGGVSPRASAYVVRNVCTICQDNGATRDTFTPGKLAYTLAGMPTGAWDSLFQDSAGRFYLMLAYPSTTQGGTPTSVVATFGATPTSVTEFDLSDGTTGGLTPLQTVTGSATVTSSLTGSVRCLRVVP